MRIRSPFRDYYDGVQSCGQDQTLVYLRLPKDLPTWPAFKHCPAATNSYTVRNRISNKEMFTFDVWVYQVGFCGKVYPVLLLEREDKVACFNASQVDDYVRERFSEEDYESFCLKRRDRLYFKSGWPMHKHKSDFEKYFDEARQEEDKFLEFFIANRCPLFLATDWDGLKNPYAKTRHCTINASLKDVQFYRLFEPYQAYQEIAMFLGNMAEPRKPIPHISDEVMAEAKGFDKHSFRKDSFKGKLL